MTELLKQSNKDICAILEKAAVGPISWVGLRLVNSHETWDVFRDGKFDHHHSAKDQGMMVEVLAHGQLAYSATHNLTHRGLELAIESAYAQAKAAAPFKVFDFNAACRPGSVGNFKSETFKKNSTAHADVISLLPNLCHTMQKVSEHIVKTVASFSLTETETRYLSSNGAEIIQSFVFGDLSLLAMAQKDGVIQKRSDGGHVFQKGYELALSPSSYQMAQRIAEQALELVHAPECPSLKTHLVLAPDQMMLQIHESIGHPLELDRILGDERNYAGSSFVKLEDFGTLKYGSELMNVTFDPNVTGEIASYAFDDCGVPAQKQYLIKDGLLLRGLGGLESQIRSGVLGVANQRACSWNRPPIDRMANINLEPGKSSFEDMISLVDSGIYMESNRSWSIDDYRNKFQFGCEYARMIRNGKLCEVVRNPNYRGVTNSFWKSLFAVGNEASFQVFGTSNCGKGEPNQSIRVGHASPVCAFRDIEVFGGVG